MGVTLFWVFQSIPAYFLLLIRQAHFEQLINRAICIETINHSFCLSGQVRMLYFSDLRSMQNPFPKLCQFLLLKNQCNPKPRGNFSEINSLFSPKTLSIKNGEGINQSISRKLGNLKKTHIGDHRRVYLSEGPYIGMLSIHGRSIHRSAIHKSEF